MLNETMTKRKDGRIELKVTLGSSPSGKRIRKSFYGKTEREVNRKKIEWMEANSIVDIEDTTTMSFSNWADKWLLVYKKDTVRAYTYENTYRTRVEKYLKPYFEHRPLRAITSADIQAFFNAHRKLSLALLKTLRVILNDIFNKAIDNDLCSKNPVSNVRLQSVQKKQARKAYNAMQYDKAVQWAIKNQEYDILTVLKTGVRRGELLGLKWSDFDFVNLTMNINESISPPVVSGGEIDYELKTEASEDTLPIDATLAECIQSMPRVSDRVFNCTNANVYGKRVKTTLERMAKECNLPYLTLHELRHSLGTVLREKGVDIYTISKILRHSSIGVTASVYVHNDIEVLRKAMGM